ncbi:MAG: ABC transporter permease [Chloroflexi bacterium]|nr:ABC transporter permease [Chloroflexota bacterium]
MNTIRRKIIADVLSRRGRTLLVSLSIMVGVFGVSLLVGTGDIISGQLRDDLRSEKLAMLDAYLDLPDGQTDQAENQAILADIENLPDVEQAMGQVFSSVAWRSAGTMATSDDDYTDGAIVAYTDPMDDLPLEPITDVVDGGFPRVGQREVAIERRFAEAHDIKVGDQLVFEPRPGEEEAAPWTVSGILYAPYLAVRIDEMDLVIFAHYEDAQQIGDFGGLRLIVVRYSSFEAAQDNETALTRYIAAETPYTVTSTFFDDPENNLQLQQVNDVVVALNILAIITMVVSGFLVVNVINTIVAEQRNQIGIMKSLGATRLETFLIFAGMALVYGIVGTTLGIVLSIPATAFMSDSLADLASTYLDGFQISALGIGIGITLGLAVPVVVTIIPVWAGTRVSILEAVTDFGISSRWGRGRIAHLIRRIPVPLNFRQSISNVIQKRWRLTLTLVTLTLAAGSFMGVTAAFSLVDDLIEDIFSQFDHDIIIYPDQAQSTANIERILQDAEIAYDSIAPGFEVQVGLEGYKNPNAVVESNQLYVSGIDVENSGYNLDLRDGEVWRTDIDCVAEIESPDCRTVILSATVANMIGKGAGDTVEVTGGGETAEFTIVGVDDIPFDIAYFRWEVLALVSRYVTVDGAPAPNTFYLQLDADNPSISEVDDAIEEIEAALLAANVQHGIDNRPAIEADEQDFMDMFSMLFNLTAIVLASVGGIGLLAVLSMSVLERQKEIGVMRSIGSGSLTVMTQFLGEGLVIALIAWAFGLPISLAIAPMLIDSLPAGTTVDFTYPLTVPFIGLAGAVLFATVASLWPSISAARKTVSDILRYQ